MDIRYKLYPYPVLSSYSDDYVDSSFDAVVVPNKEGYNIKIDFLAELDNPDLKNHLENGNVKIVYHIECSQTGFRIALQTENTELSHVISNKSICGRVQICPFVVAVKDIQDYVNKSFNEDYRGFKFSIEAGCILAVGRQVNIDVDKDLNDLTNTPSVFIITKNADTTALSMIVDMDQNKIVVKLPERDYYNYKVINDESSIQPILNSLVIIPALIYVLQELKMRMPDERYEYSSYSWYRAIKKALSSHFHCDIESTQFSEMNMIDTAQKLINTPISDALQVLSSVYGNVYEEEEE